jgi:tRNA-intron lyase
MLLFDEEAFYLFINNHLTLKLSDGSDVTTEQLWSKFIEKNSKFPIKYKVYSFFRDQGFVVKTGVHYGLDYAVYRTLPTLCHSEMCAMVVDATQVGMCVYISRNIYI